MRPEKHGDTIASRRKFLKQMGWAPVLFLPSSLRGPLLLASPSRILHDAHFPFAEVRLQSHYPVSSRLDEIMRRAAPGADEYGVEGHVAAIKSALSAWSEKLKESSPATVTLSQSLDPSIQANALSSAREVALRPGDAIQAVRRQFDASLLPGRERFLQDVRSYLSSLRRIEVADFEIYSCTPVTDSSAVLDTSIRYEIVGAAKDEAREQRIGSWKIHWLRDASGHWKATQWIAIEETVTRASAPVFLDITSHALGNTNSYQKQLLHGADYWRTVLDGAIGVDVYGNNGVAVGDSDNDGLDDLYVCQPAGLPNRLYRNRGDGTFEDVTEQSGVGVLDFTACALFADFQNRGLQDLLVVCATGPLLYANQGDGRFSLQRDAFQFARAPQGAFTHAAVADYDHDGRLDVYFCLYNYYQGLDQYRYPVPYFDARNGPPNYLFHNQGNGTFLDRTESARLNLENDRYSFACSWGDSNGNGWPDLYVVNDFGRNNLYRNNGDGTFAAVSKEAKVDEVGAGMSACWLDFDNDGKPDIYAAGMWVAAGMRVFEDPHFHSGEPANIRDLYRRHMTGNSMYRNRGGTFENVAPQAGVEMARWSWSTDAWDFDNDGYPDLYVANGYISGLSDLDVSSFFWRQVVAKSPVDSTPSPAYEVGWGAINELIRSDATWNGHERNVFFVNNRDGTFSDAAGVVGLDFRDDSRAFVLSDFDGDGRLEVVLKNRNAPQVRILRLAMDSIGNSICLRLQGEKSNRDAIGAAVTVETGTLRQTKFIQAGSGFLSQHTKELFFGIGQTSAPVCATVQWPSGLTQTFDSLPVNCRIQIRESSAEFQAKPYAVSPAAWKNEGNTPKPEIPPTDVQTWLIDPVKAPYFSLPDLAGNLRSLRDFEGRHVLLNFWTSEAPACLEQLQIFREVHSRLASDRLSVLAINLDVPSDSRKLKSLAAVREQPYSILLADPDTAGIYNIVYRYLFSRHRNLPLPISFLIDGSGKIVRVYQGQVTAQQISADLKSIPETAADRLRTALPFPGHLVQDAFQRNAFTYGVAFFQNGFLKEAAQAFKQVIAEKPQDPEAYYNLGTVYLRQNSPIEAKEYLEQALNLRPNYPEAWNNLGMIAAQKGDDPAAITNFEKSLELRPAYATARLNLANVYRRQGNSPEAEKLLNRALADEPANPEINYSLGMVYARGDNKEKAILFLQKAVALRPGYADALNNLGVLFVQTHHYQEAKQNFDECIRVAPEFDQAYLNLARLDLMQNEKDEARAVLQALLQKQPQHQMARQMLEMLY